jgi:hypothetical protein
MAIHRRRKFWLAAAVLAVGTAFQTLPTGCAGYYTELGLSGFNFCSVFNCDGGTFFNLCQPVAVLVDCPTLATTTQ